MRSLLTVVVCVGSLAILGCGGDDDDDPRQLSANLTGAQEVPPVNTAATGTATLRINEEQTQIDFTLIVSTAPQTPIREAHLHIAPAGVNGPIVLDFCTTSLVNPPADVPLPPPCPPAPFTLNGSLTALNLRTLTQQQIQATGVNSFADAVNQILAGNAYANVHTENFRGGEIRGQLIVQQ
ncbi:MAG TPA: CHRD domain-containing protein [Candidatus Tectomicrobia bacterium]